MVDDDNMPAREERDAEAQRDVVMQRVRVGLTGLGTVFLLTLLAASIFSLLGQDDQHNAAIARGSNAGNVATAEEAPKEPLAELGVAPGGNTPKPAAPAAATPPGDATTVAPVASQPMTGSPTPARGAPGAVTGALAQPANAPHPAAGAHHQPSVAPQG